MQLFVNSVPKSCYTVIHDYMYVYICICVYMYVCIYVDPMHVCMYIYIYIYACAYSVLSATEATKVNTFYMGSITLYYLIKNQKK